MAQTKKAKKENFGKVLFTVLSILLIIMTLAATWLFVSYRDAVDQIEAQETQEQTEGQLAEEKVQKIINQVGHHILLPEGEKPVVARLEDAENLKTEQAFFQYAENGDFLLIYSDRGIVYSPEKDILINVGPTQSPQVKGASVEIRNGSLTSGAAQELGDQIDMQPAYTVVGIGNAANFNYEKTILVNLGEQDVSSLEEALGVTAVTEMPEGEAQPAAEVIVIIGNN